MIRLGSLTVPHVTLDASQARKYADQKAQERFQARLNAAKIPARYRCAKIDSCDGWAHRYATKIAGGSGEWLVISGDNGCGKTFSAAAILREVIRAKHVTLEEDYAKGDTSTTLRVTCGKFATMQGILDDIKATFSERFGTEEDAIARWVNTPLLVIDDVGKEAPTEWSLPVIFAVLDGRYAKQKPTLITTNLTGATMRAHYSKAGSALIAESIVSRIAEADHVRLRGSDRRMRHV